MNILPYKTADSNRNMTSRAGLAMLADLIQRLGLNPLADRFVPAPDSERETLRWMLEDSAILEIQEREAFWKKLLLTRGVRGMNRN